MPFLLDTNVIITYLNGRSHKVRAKVDRERSGLAICAVVRAELEYGAQKSARPKATRARQAEFLADLVSHPFDDACAIEYGLIRGRLEKAGTPIGPNDLMIAAIALQHDLTLVTANIREFERVPDLKVENWES